MGAAEQKGDFYVLSGVNDGGLREYKFHKQGVLADYNIVCEF